MAKWLIFCATIRDKRRTALVFARIYASLTQFTDFIIVDGTNRKSVEEYRIISRLAGDYDYFCSIDDDLLVPGLGWQDDIEQAFKDVPKLGCAAIEYADTPELNEYIIEKSMQYTFKQTKIRIQQYQNLPGACMVFPSEIIKQIKPVPHIEGVTYEYFEDGWKCGQLKEMGYRWGYVECKAGYAEIQKYTDDPAYLVMKKHDIEATREKGLPW